MEKSKDRDSGNYKDFCFKCKDTPFFAVGSTILVMCDVPDCRKAYHTECVGMDDECIPDPWSCELHSCLICHKSPEFNCLCCPKAFCRECVVRVKFVQIKEKNGLCSFCLKYALIVEKNKDADSDMGYVKFFRDYWKNIDKEKESLTFENLLSADARMKSGQWCISGSDLDEHDKHVGINMLSEFYSTDGGEASADEKMDESVELERKAKSVHEDITKHEENVAIGEGARVANQHSANHDDSEKINEFGDIPGDEKGKEGDEKGKEISGDSVDNIQTQSPKLFPILNFKRKRSEAENVRENLVGVKRTNNSAATEDPTLAQALDILHGMAEEMEEINPFTSLYHFSEIFLLDEGKRRIFVTSFNNQTRLASLRYNYQAHLRNGGI